MKVPASSPYFSEEDIEWVTGKFKEILRGQSYLSMSKYGEEFEKKFSRYIGTKYSVGCNSGTSALEMILRGLKIQGKEVILPSNTFVATALAVINAGGTPVFCECEGNLCIDSLDVEKKINNNTAAVVVVHIGGLISSTVLDIKRLCEDNNLFLVEDAAQAHGSSLNGIRAGRFGIAAGFSFFSTKLMTMGEGGIVTTNDADLAAKIRSLREFGKVRKGIYGNYYDDFGYNWRMPEVSALLGLKQLEAIDDNMARRREIARMYDSNLERLKNIDIVRVEDPSNHNYYKYIVHLDGIDREFVHRELEKRGISPSGYVYEFPLHKLPVFRSHNDLILPKTECYSASHMCLPIFFSMTNEQVFFVIQMFKDIVDV